MRYLRRAIGCRSWPDTGAWRWPKSCRRDEPDRCASRSKGAALPMSLYCFRASFSCRLRRATSSSSPTAENARRIACFGAVRRFNFRSLWASRLARFSACCGAAFHRVLRRAERHRSRSKAHAGSGLPARRAAPWPPSDRVCQTPR
jgi:hypothetical protein